MALVLNIPLIETERLFLRAFEPRDFAAVAAYKADEDVMKFSGGVESALAAWKSFGAMIGHWATMGHGYFCIADKKTDLCLGHCGLMYPPSWPDRELSFTLSGAAQGKGLATEASAAALGYAYEHLGWCSAISLIHPDNSASRRVAEKLGATLEEENVPVWGHVVGLWRHLSPPDFFETILNSRH